MASVNYYLIGKNTPSRVTCRFRNGRQLDVKKRISIHIEKKHWDIKKQRVKNIAKVEHGNLINLKLEELRNYIIAEFNVSFLEGEIIDGGWLQTSINRFFNRPIGEGLLVENHTVYYLNFAKWWIENKSSTWLTSSETYLGDRAKAQYSSFISLITQFQAKKKIKLGKDANTDITNFVNWLNDNAYATKTITRHVKRFKFFYQRAKELGFKVDSSFEMRVFVPKTEEVLEAYLNVDEIEQIYQAEMPTARLEDARDNLIIACWTGLRVSDYLNTLDISNFIDDFIEIKTSKTKTRVSIPVHPMIKKILIKRDGQLPPKVQDSAFNRQIKEVCMHAGINEEMKGRKFDSVIHRKTLGLYKKYELVSSHIGRRSFATNHYGKMPNSVIMSVCGWTKESMMLTYIKKSNREGAVMLKKYWDEQFKTI
jgi:integrase